jgi:putative tricarboxylic transport membrane protein
MISASTPNLTTQLSAGRIRPLAVATGQRIGAPLADVPTWRELGVDAEYSSVQGLLAPKGLSAEQGAWWTNALRAVSEADEWKAFMQKQNWKPKCLPQAEMMRFLESEEAVARSLLSDLGLLKR